MFEPFFQLACTTSLLYINNVACLALLSWRNVGCVYGLDTSCIKPCECQMNQTMLPCTSVEYGCLITIFTLSIGHTKFRTFMYIDQRAVALAQSVHNLLCNLAHNVVVTFTFVVTLNLNNTVTHCVPLCLSFCLVDLALTC